MNQITRYEVPFQTSACMGICLWRCELLSGKHTEREISVVLNQILCQLHAKVLQKREIKPIDKAIALWIIGCHV